MFYCDKKFIGKNLQNFRRKLGIKQSELAEKIGISEKHLSKIETGKNYPSLDNFLKMAEILEFSLEDFGLKIKAYENESREEILKLIYAADDEKIASYLKIITSLDEILDKKHSSLN